MAEVDGWWSVERRGPDFDSDASGIAPCRLLGEGKTTWLILRRIKEPANYEQKPPRPDVHNPSRL